MQPSNPADSRKGSASQGAREPICPKCNKHSLQWDDFGEGIFCQDCGADFTPSLLHHRATTADKSVECSPSKIALRPDRIPELEPSLDEVCASNVENVHIERMSDSHYWIGIDCADGRHIRVGIYAKRATIRMSAEVESESPGPHPHWGFGKGGLAVDEFEDKP